MTLVFFQPSNKEQAAPKRYYISKCDGNTYQVIDSVENREICVCSNYDDWEDAEERAKNIAKALNANILENKKTLG